MTDQPLSFEAAGVPENPDRVRAVKRRIAAAVLLLVDTVIETDPLLGTV
jgi:hypothetical protein